MTVAVVVVPFWCHKSGLDYHQEFQIKSQTNRVTPDICKPQKGPPFSGVTLCLFISVFFSLLAFIKLLLAHGMLMVTGQI